MPSRADTHDLDKLKRWQKDLEDTPDGVPPVFAIFLVSGEDRAAHDVFRAFRTSFEERNLGFAHLVIFGQHGVSETARRLQARFGLEEGGAPSLVLFLDESGQPQILSLPAGEPSDSNPNADLGLREALNHAVGVVDGAGHKGKPVRDAVSEICRLLMDSQST